MHESDTYLAIVDEGRAKARREDIILLAEALLGSVPETVHSQLANVTDLERLKRMVRSAATATSWQDILDTP